MADRLNEMKGQLGTIYLHSQLTVKRLETITSHGKSFLLLPRTERKYQKTNKSQRDAQCMLILHFMDYKLFYDH